MDVSIIVCTRDRAADLRQTLASLAQVRVPVGLHAELVIVDNGSRDETASVARAFRWETVRVRYLKEPRPGKSHAYNSALAAAQGEILLCTDDDVRFPSNWIEGMIAPIVRGQAEAVAGGVRLAPHLERPWMTVMHRVWMADTKEVTEGDFEMIGANMAFHRRVLEKVPGFDPDLGPGVTGVGEDSLFTWQLREAGFRVVLHKSTEVEHHFDPRRLRRHAFLARAAGVGRTRAYLAWHWEHCTISWPMLRGFKAAVRLAGYRARNGLSSDRGAEGCDAEELWRVSGLHFYRQYLRERRRPRNYARRGLVKLHS